jgi:hypothetical protein
LIVDTAAHSQPRRRRKVLRGLQKSRVAVEPVSAVTHALSIFPDATRSGVLRENSRGLLQQTALLVHRNEARAPDFTMNET